jgi:hypothetical protein
MIDPDDPGTIPLPGMHRVPDHATSIEAAHKVKRWTLRQIVGEYALSCGRFGFTDDDLKRDYANNPESSLRKRRTELAQENRLLDSGLTRANRFGQQEIVWVHRDFHPSPPPIQERDTTPKQSRLARAEARVADAVDLVALLFPYVEEASESDADDPACPYSREGIQRMRALTARARKFIEAN